MQQQVWLCYDRIGHVWNPGHGATMAQQCIDGVGTDRNATPPSAFSDCHDQFDMTITYYVTGSQYPDRASDSDDDFFFKLFPHRG